jgi:hypothetical protein
VCISSPYLSEAYWANRGFDIPIDFQNKEMTPDLVLITQSGFRKIIEFKASLNRFSHDKKQRLRGKAVASYGDNVVVHFIHIRASLANNLPVDYFKLANVFPLWYTEITDALKDWDPYNKILEKVKTLPSLSKMIQSSDKIQETYKRLSKEVERNPLEFDPNNHNMDENVTALWENVERMEKFSNANFLSIADMAGMLNIVSTAITPNVFLDSPWDRDSNRAIRTLRSGVPQTWGHRANYLLHNLPTGKVVQMTWELLKKHIEKVSPKVTDMNNMDDDFNKDILILLKASIELNSNHKELKIELSELNKDLAIILQDPNETTMDDIAIKYNVTGFRVNRLLIEGALRDKINLIRAEISKRLPDNTQITKHGNLKLLSGVLLERAKIMKNATKRSGKKVRAKFEEAAKSGNIAQAEKLIRNKVDKMTVERLRRGDAISKPEDTRLEMGDYFENFRVEPGTFIPYKNISFPDCQNAYPFNDSLNSLSNRLNSLNKETFEHLTSSQQFWSVFGWYEHMKSLVMAAPRVMTKGLSLNELVLTRNVMGYFTVMTASPNSITTGMCINIGVLSTKQLPSYFLPGEYYDIGNDQWLYISIPYRLNLKIVSQCEHWLGSYIGFMAQAYEYGYKDLSRDWFTTSLWWSYSRGISSMYDIIYLLMKSVGNVGSFGKRDAKDKLALITFKDSRVATMFTRLKTNYRDFINSIDINNLPHSLIGKKDPIFPVKHIGVQTVQLFTFIKQVLPKNDGFDPTQIAAGFYRKDMDYQMWYMKSFFNHYKMHYNESMDPHKFFDLLFSDDIEGDNSDCSRWSKLGYHPDTVYHLLNYMYDSAKERGIKPFEKYKEWDIPAQQTGKKSKVLLPTSQHALYGVPIEIERKIKKKQRYPSMISTDLPEALTLEEILAKNIIAGADIKVWDRTDDTLFSKLINPDIDKDALLSLVELTLIEIKIYPNAMMLCCENKEQSGHDKRNFFVQVILKRNENKLADSAFRALLKGDKYDMILLPGLTKVIQFENDMRFLGIKKHFMKVTQDMSKFGDSYDPRIFMLLVVSGFFKNYVNEDEAKMLLHFFDGLTRKIVIMPSTSARLYKANREGRYISDKENKWVIALQTRDNLLQDPNRFRFFEGNSVFADIHENPLFHKEAGFTLGVYNITASVFSALYTHLMEKAWAKWGLNKVFMARTHSDDSAQITLFECPRESQFIIGNFDVTSLILKLLAGHSRLVQKGSDFYLLENEETLIKLDSSVLGKAHLMLVLFCPRAVSQCPSLLKTLFGTVFEVLQVTATGLSMHVPLLRSTSAISRNASNRSVHMDTISRISEVYNIITMGGTVTLSSQMMMWANFLVSEAWGFHNSMELRTVHKPTEWFGLWWSIPSFILEFGFEANDARLLSYKDLETQLFLMWTVDTNEVWAREHKVQTFQDKVVIAQEEFETDNFAESAGLTHRRVLSIHWNQTAILDQGFQKILHLAAPFVRKEFRRILFTAIKVDEKNIDEILTNPLYELEEDKLLKLETLIQTMGGNVRRKLMSDINSNPDNNRLSSMVHKVAEAVPLNQQVRVILNAKKITLALGAPTFSDSLLKLLDRYMQVGANAIVKRVGTDMKMINQLGFCARVVGNLFTEKVNEKLQNLNVIINGSSTVLDIYNAIIALSINNVVPPESSMKGYSLHRSLVASFLHKLSNTFIKIDHEDPSYYYDRPLRFESITNLEGMVSTTAKPALIAVYEMMSGTPFMETTPVQMFERLAFDEGFYETVTLIRARCEAIKLSREDIWNNFGLLQRVFHPGSIKAIVKTGGVSDLIIQNLRLLWSYTTILSIGFTESPSISGENSDSSYNPSDDESFRDSENKQDNDDSSQNIPTALNLEGLLQAETKFTLTLTQNPTSMGTDPYSETVLATTTKIPKTVLELLSQEDLIHLSQDNMMFLAKDANLPRFMAALSLKNKIDQRVNQLRDFVYFKNNRKITIPKPEEIFKEMFTYGFSKKLADLLLFSIVYYKFDLELGAGISFGRVAIIGKIPELGVVIVTGNSSNPTAMDLKDKSTDWDIYIQSEGVASTYNLAIQLITIGRLFTYWIPLYGDKIKDPKSLKGEGEFAAFGGSDIVYQGSEFKSSSKLRIHYRSSNQIDDLISQNNIVSSHLSDLNELVFAGAIKLEKRTKRGIEFLGYKDYKLYPTTTTIGDGPIAYSRNDKDIIYREVYKQPSNLIIDSIIYLPFYGSLKYPQVIVRNTFLDFIKPLNQALGIPFLNDAELLTQIGEWTIDTLYDLCESSLRLFEVLKVKVSSMIRLFNWIGSETKSENNLIAILTLLAEELNPNSLNENDLFNYGVCMSTRLNLFSSEVSLFIKWLKLEIIKENEDINSSSAREVMKSRRETFEKQVGKPFSWADEAEMMDLEQDEDNENLLMGSSNLQARQSLWYNLIDLPELKGDLDFSHFCLNSSSVLPMLMEFLKEIDLGNDRVRLEPITITDDAWSINKSLLQNLTQIAALCALKVPLPKLNYKQILRKNDSLNVNLNSRGFMGYLSYFENGGFYIPRFFPKLPQSMKWGLFPLYTSTTINIAYMMNILSVLEVDTQKGAEIINAVLDM